LKAIAYQRMSGVATLADDSGLQVDFLDGKPGVKSARYAGENATDAENVEKLLAELSGVPVNSRAARFQCVIAVALPGKEVATFTGSVEGTIAVAPKGEGGFGYDPVFVLSGSDHGGKTMAQLSPFAKAKLSHRGRAAARAARWLRSQSPGAEYN
jgi:XTP/dITP diphosphohydrolase